MTSSNVGEPLLPSDPTTEDQKSKRFRFKAKHQRSEDDERTDDRKRRRRHHHGSHQRSKRHKTSGTVDDPSAYDSSSGLPPHAAFRESLFDAMGDDEGAAFWEGVYGQPIHNYPDTYQNQETGELERMDEEEYAQFVRRKMWEKSWEGIEAAKEEKRREREQEKQKIRDEERARSRREMPQKEADYLFDLDIERSLRRGERRRDQKRWTSIWDNYLQQWQDLRALCETRSTFDGKEPMFLRNKIAWPVESGKRKDVNPEEVKQFITRCAEATDSDTSNLLSILKLERVRWHPDKIQQRYGFMDIDEGTMQGVTAVFQIVDRMWSDHRGQG